MNPLDALAGWHLKAICAAIFLGVLGLGFGALWLTKAAVEKDRGQIITWGENVCASVAVPYRVDAKGKPLKRSVWGTDCAAKILKLATDAAGAATASLDTYVAHDAEQDTKAATDRPAARRSTARLAKAQQTLETAHAAAENGRYGREWIDGLSDAFGLRDAQGTSDPAASGGGDAAGTPDAGPAGMLGSPAAPPG